MELSTQTWREIFIIIIFPFAYFEAASSPYKGIWLNHLVGLMHQALLENLYHKAIHHFRNEKATGAEMCHVIDVQGQILVPCLDVIIMVAFF